MQFRHNLFGDTKIIRPSSIFNNFTYKFYHSCLWGNVTVTLPLLNKLKFIITKIAAIGDFFLFLMELPARGGLLGRVGTQSLSRHGDLNPRPPPYHGGALPLSYVGNYIYSSLTENCCKQNCLPHDYEVVLREATTATILLK